MKWVSLFLSPVEPMINLLFPNNDTVLVHEEAEEEKKLYPDDNQRRVEVSSAGKPKTPRLVRRLALQKHADFVVKLMTHDYSKALSLSLINPSNRARIKNRRAAGAETLI